MFTFQGWVERNTSTLNPSHCLPKQALQARRRFTQSHKVGIVLQNLLRNVRPGFHGRRYRKSMRRRESSVSSFRIEGVVGGVLVAENYTRIGELRSEALAPMGFIYVQSPTVENTDAMPPITYAYE